MVFSFRGDWVDLPTHPSIHYKAGQTSLSAGNNPNDIIHCHGSSSWTCQLWGAAFPSAKLPLCLLNVPFMIFWWVKPCPFLVPFICIFPSFLSQKSSHTDHLPSSVCSLCLGFFMHTGATLQREALGPT